jgi:uncharacterized glyoxalase superfamily protein PhnB
MPATQQAQLLRSATYLPVPDVVASGRWYHDVLGFECEYEAGAPAEFAIWKRGGVAVMLRRVSRETRLAPNESQGGSWDLFAWVDDADALHDEIVRAGATIVYPPVVQPYGMKEFAVRDPDGYVLGFGQRMPRAAG